MACTCLLMDWVLPSNCLTSKSGVAWEVLMTSSRRASILVCMAAEASCLTISSCRACCTEPTDSIEASMPTTRLPIASIMLSSCSTRLCKRQAMAPKTPQATTIKQPHRKTRKNCSRRCCTWASTSFLEARRNSIPASAAMLAERLARSAESMSTNFMSVMLCSSIALSAAARSSESPAPAGFVGSMSVSRA